MATSIGNNSGSTGWPTSARHMDGIEAALVIKENLISNCRFKRFDWNFPDEIAALNKELNTPPGNTIRYIGMADKKFKDEMKFRGMSYWCRGFELCENSMNQHGVEVAPSTTDGIIDDGTSLDYSLLLNSSKNKASYIIHPESGLSQQVMDPNILSINAAIVDELNLSHKMVETLAVGYLAGRAYEPGYKKRYGDKNIAFLYLYAEIFGIRY